MEGKDAFLKQYEGQLKEWAAKIGQLVARAEKAEGDAKAEYEKQVSVLQTKKAALESQVAELRNAAEGAWESLKTGVERAADDLKSAVEQALSRFR